MSTSVDEILERARWRILRVSPYELQSIIAAGGLVVDIRPSAQRGEQGPLPQAHVVERNLLEWRFDPTGSHRLAELRGLDQPIVIVCSDGYASSLAAASLRDLGYARSGDLIGGYRAWQAWFDRGPADVFRASQPPEPSRLGIDPLTPSAGPPRLLPVLIPRRSHPDDAAPEP